MSSNRNLRNELEISSKEAPTEITRKNFKSGRDPRNPGRTSGKYPEGTPGAVSIRIPAVVEAFRRNYRGNSQAKLLENTQMIFLEKSPTLKKNY